MCERSGMPIANKDQPIRASARMTTEETVKMIQFVMEESEAARRLNM
jgi:hypothetical protein